MNKGQKILFAIVILILEVVLLGGAYLGSKGSYYDIFDLNVFSRDIRVYIAMLLIGVGGYFLLRGKKHD